MYSGKIAVPPGGGGLENLYTTIILPTYEKKSQEFKITWYKLIVIVYFQTGQHGWQP
jgi:hypothetical protein